MDVSRKSRENWTGRNSPLRHGVSRSQSASRELSLVVVVSVILGHILLAVLMYRVPSVATFHALLTFVVGVFVALTTNDRARTVFVVGYMVSSEVLWRMTGAGVFWEFGKYGVAAVLLIFLIRRPPDRWNWAAMLYFMLLIPSLVFTCLEIADLSQLRRIVSFNLSGPFVLLVCSICLYRSAITYPQLKRLLIAMLGPFTGVAAICIYSMSQLGADYDFGNESNFDITGGFGPNQVSSSLGFAALLGFFWVQLGGAWRQKGVGIICILMFLGVAALTFSRTGVWIGALSIITALVFLVHGKARMISILASIIVLLGIGSFIIYPWLDSYTQGKLSDRFLEKGFSGRERIAKEELKLAFRNPVFGAGLGMSKIVRDREFDYGAPAHTEFTRMIAEHGFLGVLALSTLATLVIGIIRGNRGSFGRAWSASLLVFAFLFMMGTGMRLAAPAFAIGIALVQIRGVKRGAAGRIKVARNREYPSRQISLAAVSR